MIEDKVERPTRHVLEESTESRDTRATWSNGREKEFQVTSERIETWSSEVPPGKSQANGR